LSDHFIVKLSLGYYHAAAINDKGQVFTWGRGINGQLGHGSILNEDSLRVVSALINQFMIDIACGESHSMSLTNKGEVFTWGGGQLGQLGHGDFLR
jgi:RCC1 and BTB domain-containing protein